MQETSKKVMAVWVGSFVIVGSFLFFHFGVPLVPIVLAGVLSLGVTAVRYLSDKRVHSIRGGNP